MDRQPARLDFAIIGHQDSWEHIAAFVNAVRLPGAERLPEVRIRELFSFIPPRALFSVEVKSKTGQIVRGAYIETFIDPDQLDQRHLRTNLAKVKAAAECTERLGARIVTLGGFTSIVLEGNLDLISTKRTARFTTGNTLTAAFIVKGVESAAAKYGINLSSADLLVVGSTGDIGQACVQYFKTKVKSLLLNARNLRQLEKQACELIREGISVLHGTELSQLTGAADIIISAASSSGIILEGCREHVIVCDAGYPKNIDRNLETQDETLVFHGGMGRVSSGYSFDPDYQGQLYRFPLPRIAHGCVLEAIALAFDRESEFASSGKGNITEEHIEQMYATSSRHGIELAPLFNSRGLLQSSTHGKLKVTE